MNEIFNNFLLVGAKFIPEMHLRQSRFTYSVCIKNHLHQKQRKNTKQTFKKQEIHNIFIKIN